MRNLRTHCIPNPIVLMIPLLSGSPLFSRSKCFSDGESNGEIRWVWHESMRVAAKLTIFRGYLSKETFVIFAILFCDAPFERNRMEQTDKRNMAIMYLDPAEIRCSEDVSDNLLTSLSAYLAYFLYRNLSELRYYSRNSHKTVSSHRNNANEYFMTELQ
jgi:hypothetical protein